MFKVLSFGPETVIYETLVYCPLNDTLFEVSPNLHYFRCVRMLLLMWKPLRPPLFQVCQDATVDVETTKLVINQLNFFYCSKLRIVLHLTTLPK